MDDVDGGAARRALLGVECVGADGHRLDGFRRRHVSDVDRQPGISVQRAVQPGVVGLRRNAVLEHGNGALRIARRRIGFARSGSGGRARLQQQQGLEVLAFRAVIRQFLHFRAPRSPNGRRPYRFAAPRHRPKPLPIRWSMQSAVARPRAARRSPAPEHWSLQRAERFRRDVHLVQSRLQIGETVNAAIVGIGFVFDVGAQIRWLPHGPRAPRRWRDRSRFPVSVHRAPASI